MKRRKHSAEFKLQVVQEALETGNKSLMARRYELSPNLVHKWAKAYHNGELEDASSEVKS